MRFELVVVYRSESGARRAYVQTVWARDLMDAIDAARQAGYQKDILSVSVRDEMPTLKGKDLSESYA